ncbi:hypothetical protein [Alteromonas facilis]|uniref:hypothetical protein n=1 Tax=Alteromonas facilis TaxID=2048004 RepID=UPI000C28AC97|nr:hypothetical protein [Alteromonas facilis]
MSYPQKKGGHGWIVVLVILGALHWFVAGWSAQLFFSECKNDEQDSRNPPICACQKSEFRQSFMLEQFAFSALSENEELSKSLSQKVEDISQQCRGQSPF